MAEVQLQRISIKHEAILNYMLTNPAEKLGKVAEHFRVSQAWLSVIVHSDVFQGLLAEKNQEFSHESLIPLREKVLGVAHLAVDKLSEAIEHSSPVSDKAYIADTTNLVLKSLGYGASVGPAAGGGAPVVNNTVIVANKDDLAKARGLMRAVQGVPQEATEGVLIEQGCTTSDEV